MENLLIQQEFVRNVASKKGKSKVAMFGIELNDFMETQKKEIPRFLNVPLLIRICGDEIITRGLNLIKINQNFVYFYELIRLNRPINVYLVFILILII